jgi:protein-tyrosine phosphatase
MRILFVCMGNICRSPSAEAVLRHVAATEAPELQLEIDSAGTHEYHLGHLPDARAVRAAQRRDIDMSGLRARKLLREDFERFDLVLVMDEQNKQDALAIAPTGQHARVRLFLEFAPQLSHREIPDPYYGNEIGFELVLDLVTEASRGLIAHIRGMKT